MVIFPLVSKVHSRLHTSWNYPLNVFRGIYFLWIVYVGRGRWAEIKKGKWVVTGRKKFKIMERLKCLKGVIEKIKKNICLNIFKPGLWIRIRVFWSDPVLIWTFLAVFIDQSDNYVRKYQLNLLICRKKKEKVDFFR